MEGENIARTAVNVRISNSNKNDPSNLSDRVTEMEERTSTLEQKAVGQKNTQRKCQDKGGINCLQFVPL